MRVTASTIPKAGESVAIAVTAMEQNGQECVHLSVSFRDAQHAQKLNWATRKTNASNRAQHLSLWVAILICNDYCRPEILPYVHPQTILCGPRPESKQLGLAARS